MFEPELMFLADLMLTEAREDLKKKGFLLPVVMYRLTDGSTGVTRGVYQGGDSRKESVSLRIDIENGLRKQALEKKVWFCALCSNHSGEVPGYSKKTDAIHVFLEHEDGRAMNLFVPYTKNWFGRLCFKERFAVPAENRIFKISSR